MSNIVFCLMGPTASGKTALAMELLNHFPFEIISVDSAMIYRGMDIGTAKPSQLELNAAPHHLIDILDPPEIYSAAEFCKQARALITRIHCADKIPLLVGGTMMYFNALQHGLSNLPNADQQLRADIVRKAQDVGWPNMHEELIRIDPVIAERIHPHDAQRIQRALEVYYVSGQPLSSFKNSRMPQDNWQYVNLMLFPKDRACLHQRIAERFYRMLEQGFLDEVKQLLETWDLTLQSPALRCVGYRQAYDYFIQSIDYDTLCQKGIAATRQLAKRQLTWLRHWPSGDAVDGDPEQVKLKSMAIIKKILDN